MMSIVDIGEGRFADAPEMGWSTEARAGVLDPAVRVREEDGLTIATISTSFCPI